MQDGLGVPSDSTAQAINFDQHGTQATCLRLSQGQQPLNSTSDDKNIDGSRLRRHLSECLSRQST